MIYMYFVCMFAELVGCFLVSPAFLVLMGIHTAAFVAERRICDRER